MSCDDVEKVRIFSLITKQAMDVCHVPGDDRVSEIHEEEGSEKENWTGRDERKESMKMIR